MTNKKRLLVILLLLLSFLAGVEIQKNRQRKQRIRQPRMENYYERGSEVLVVSDCACHPVFHLHDSLWIVYV